jgi:hypothetical protein
MVVCPYCGAVLSRTPKRRTACLLCGKPILVRNGRLFTDEEGRAVDWCSCLRIDEAEFQRTRDRLSAQFGRVASCGDTMWRLMHTVLDAAPSWHGRKMIYFQMARFLWEEKRDCLEVRRQSVRMQLADWKAASDLGLLDLARVRVRVITAGTASCPECRRLDGHLFTCEEAESAMPLPVATCTHEKSGGQPRGWCRCTYGLVFL